MLEVSEPVTGDALQPADSKLSVAIRIGFFALIVILGLSFATAPLGLFGPVVAGSVGLCCTGLLANWLTMRIFDRRPIVQLGLQGTGASRWNLLLGIVMGAGGAGLMLLAPLLAGTGHLDVRPRVEGSWGTLLFYLVTLLIAATGEELIFRGYVFQLLIEKAGPFATILPMGILFGLAHGQNPNSTKLAIANTILWGVLLGAAFLLSRDLWLPIGLHFGWNAVLPLFGVNLSGLTIDVSRYTYRWDVSPIWSGGDYGPEGGLLATIFIAGLAYALFRAPIRPQTAYIAPSINDLWD